jgi:UDPglucose--hexose-1-phosphate uridylyltransferase
MGYVSLTEADRTAMLEAIGVGSVAELFADIPESVRLDRELDLPLGRAEQDVYAELRDLAAALQRVARGYDALWSRPMPYMMVVHQAPTDGGRDGHVHVEFYPPLRAPDRVKWLASGEQGGGTFTVDVLPEDAAEQLRAAVGRAGR